MDIRQRRARFGVGIMGLALVVVLLLGLQARQGQAHAGLDRSEPAAETTVTVAPTEVVLYFTQEVDQSGLVVAVLGPDGTRVDLQDAAVDLCDASRTRVTAAGRPRRRDLPRPVADPVSRGRRDRLRLLRVHTHCECSNTGRQPDRISGGESSGVTGRRPDRLLARHDDYAGPARASARRSPP